MAPRPDRSAERLNTNLRRSVNAARGLSFALSGVSGQLGGAVNLASQLAENVAKVSKNARIAASATGIGALVAVIGTAVAFATGWAAKTKEVAQAVREVQRETAILNAKGAGDARLATQLEIADSMERELLAATKLESKLRKFPELHEAIRNKAVAARAALDAERDRAFGDRLFELSRPGIPGAATGQTRRRLEGERDLQFERDSELRKLERNEEGFGALQRTRVFTAIMDQYRNGIAELRFELNEPIRNLAEGLGVSFADALANGISAGIQSGDIAAGFTVLGGSMLIGLGSMLQELGTQSLLASQLIATIASALASLNPAGAVAGSLALIGLGGVLKGLGASMGGRSAGRGGGGGGYAGSYGGGTTSIIDRGLVNPLNGVVTAPGSITPRSMNQYNFTVIGEDDPAAQRSIVNLIDKAEGRRS